MNYFVTANGIQIAYNLTKDKAINLGKKEYNDNTNIGIGTKKYINGKKVYKLLPLHFYL